MSEQRSTIAALWLLIKGGVHILKGYYIIKSRFHKISQKEREAEVQNWAKGFLKTWEIQLQTNGELQKNKATLLVSNHISWLDILVIHAANYVRFVAKSDVAKWAVIGEMATKAGTLYVQRKSARDAAKVVHTISDALQAGETIGIFPEGTTSDGRQLLPFHSNLIQAAIKADKEIQPAALSFIDGETGQICTAPMYIGEQTMIESIWATLKTKNINAIVTYGTPQKAEGKTRQQWALELQEEVKKLREKK